jgi:hypothetical protein
MGGAACILTSGRCNDLLLTTVSSDVIITISAPLLIARLGSLPEGLPVLRGGRFFAPAVVYWASPNA